MQHKNAGFGRTAPPGQDRLKHAMVTHSASCYILPIDLSI